MQSNNINKEINFGNGQKNEEIIDLTGIEGLDSLNKKIEENFNKENYKIKLETNTKKNENNFNENHFLDNKNNIKKIVNNEQKNSDIENNKNSQNYSPLIHNNENQNKIFSDSNNNNISENSQNDQKKKDENEKENELKKSSENDQNKKLEFIPFLSRNLLVLSTKADIDNYICPLCQGILYDPYFDKCGHVFCHDCIFSYLKNIENKCPISKLDLNETPNSMIILKNIINGKEIYCVNKKENCQWKGLIKDIDNHLKINCLKEKIKCKFKECDFISKREEMSVHEKNCIFRIVNCPSCEIQVCYKKLQDHINICPKLKIECIQKCGSELERGNMENHIKNECPNTLFECKFKEFGCQDQIMRKDMEKKMQDDCVKHMLLLGGIFNKDINNLKENEKRFRIFMNKTEEKFNEIDEKYLNRKRIRNNNNDNEINIDLNDAFDGDIDLDINNNFSQNKNKKNVFDLKHLNNDIEIIENKAICHSKNEKEHIFVFLNPIFDIDPKDFKEYKFKIKININYNSWIAFGLCDKQIVIKNFYKFNKGNVSDKFFNHGSFLVSNNGYSWNANNVNNENNKNCFFPKNSKNIYTVVYNSKKFELGFFSNDDKNPFITLTNVKPFFNNKFLTFCVLFLKKGDSAEILND